MPRTVEHIAGCHQAAAALRKAGKPIWKKFIDIKSIISEDPENESPDHIQSISKRIAALVRSKLPGKFFDFDHPEFDEDFSSAIDSMENCSLAQLKLELKQGYAPVDVFNDWLEVIYDWADVNRVWLGK